MNKVELVSPVDILLKKYGGDGDPQSQQPCQSNKEEQKDNMTFTPHPDLLIDLKTGIESIFAEQAKKISPAEALSPDQAIEMLDEYFSCMICLQVVEEPRECGQCSQLACTSCLAAWNKTQETCPNCRSANKFIGHINRFVQQKLNELEFKCVNCQQNYTYEKRNKHLAWCHQKVTCIFDQAEFDSKEALE